MSKLDKKYTAALSITYILFAASFSYAKVNWFTLIYFGAVALTIAFADKIFPKSNLTALPSSLVVTCIAMVCNSTLCEIFFSEHGNTTQFFVAAAIALFLACGMALFEPSYLPYAIICAPVMCFLSFKICVCYCVLLISICAVNISLQNHRPKNKKNKNDIEKSIRFNILAVIVSSASLALCIYRFIKADYFIIIESLVYYVKTFKNSPAVIALAIYLLVKLFKSSFNAKIPMLIGMALLSALAITGAIFVSWSIFALAFLTLDILLIYCCVQDGEIIEKIKADYHAHRFIFWVLALLLLL